MADRSELTPEENKKANLLCIVSLICELYAVGYLFSGGLRRIFDLRTEEISRVIFAADKVLEIMAGIAFIAGIVILILTRVHYPANKFSKILIWIYVIAILLIIIAFVLFIVACVTACNEIGSGMWSCLEGCGRIG